MKDAFVPGFDLALEDDGFFFGELSLPLKKISAGVGSFCFVSNREGAFPLVD